MVKTVTVISTSLRANSNSDALAQEFVRGAKEAGHKVEYISLRGKNIAFCRGCMACLGDKMGCVIKDDANAITESVYNSDVVAWALPIYYYEMPGQMKTLIDRMNTMYDRDYRFRQGYFMATAAEEEENVPDRAIAGLQGWIDCFAKAKMCGTVFGGGAGKPGSVSEDAKKKAYEMGKNV